MQLEHTLPLGHSRVWLYPFEWKKNASRVANPCKQVLTQRIRLQKVYSLFQKDAWTDWRNSAREIKVVMYILKTLLLLWPAGRYVNIILHTSEDDLADAAKCQFQVIRTSPTRQQNNRWRFLFFFLLWKFHHFFFCYCAYFSNSFAAGEKKGRGKNSWLIMRFLNRAYSWCIFNGYHWRLIRMTRSAGFGCHDIYLIRRG